MKKNHLHSKGKIFYKETLRNFKRRDLGITIFFLFLLFVFFGFLLNSIVLFFQDNRLTFIVTLPLFIFVTFIFFLYFKNRRRLVIYENCFQPQNIPLSNIINKNEFLIYFSNIRLAYMKKIKNVNVLDIYTKDDKKYQIWNPDNNAKNILIDRIKNNQIKIIEKS